MVVGLNMLKCGYLVEWWVCDDGDSGWGVELCSVYMFFRVFQIILPTILHHVL